MKEKHYNYTIITNKISTYYIRKAPRLTFHRGLYFRVRDYCKEYLRASALPKYFKEDYALRRDRWGCWVKPDKEDDSNLEIGFERPDEEDDEEQEDWWWKRNMLFYIWLLSQSISFQWLRIVMNKYNYSYSYYFLIFEWYFYKSMHFKVLTKLFSTVYFNYVILIP